MSSSVKDGKGGQIYVTESGRKRYVRKGRMFVELRTFKELLDPITKVKITQKEAGKTTCVVYFKDRTHLHLIDVFVPIPIVLDEEGREISHDALVVEVKSHLAPRRESKEPTTRKGEDGVVPFRAWEGESAGRNGLL